MPIGWSIRKHARLVVVKGAGIFDPAFFASYLAAMRDAGATGYRKFFDLRRADIKFSADDLQVLGSRLATNDTDADVAPGPIAILLGPDPPPLLLDMAILLKQHVGSSRQLRIFIKEDEATQWLDSHREGGFDAPLRPI